MLIKRTGGYLVHGDGDTREIAVAKFGDDVLGLCPWWVGNLLGELVSLAELLAHDLNDVLGVAVVLKLCKANFHPRRRILVAH